MFIYNQTVRTIREDLLSQGSPSNLWQNTNQNQTKTLHEKFCKMYLMRTPYKEAAELLELKI